MAAPCRQSVNYFAIEYIHDLEQLDKSIRSMSCRTWILRKRGSSASASGRRARPIPVVQQTPSRKPELPDFRV